MDSDVSTSFRMPSEMQAWLSQQALTRDTSRSQLVRALVREAQAAVAATEGVGGPASWPPQIAPPLHQRVPGRRWRNRKTGRFV